MKKREADFTVRFRHYLKAHPMRTAAFEVKQTLTESIAFSSVQDHQIAALMAVKINDGFLYKAPDDSRGVKPFDLFYLFHEYAFIVVKFPGEFSIIDVETWVLERDRSSRKSLTKERARQISTVTVAL